MLYNNSCYRISDLTDSFSNIRWSDAKLICNTLAPNKKAHLLQLETKQEKVWSRCLYSPFFEYLGIVRCIWYYELFEDIKGVIRIRKSKKNILCNDYIHVFGVFAVFFGLLCAFFVFCCFVCLFLLHNLYISCFIGLSPQQITVFKHHVWYVVDRNDRPGCGRTVDVGGW